MGCVKFDPAAGIPVGAGFCARPCAGNRNRAGTEAGPYWLILITSATSLMVT